MAKPEMTNELNLIGAGTVVEGKVKTPGSIRVDGKLYGELTAAQNVAVGVSGDVEGTLNAKNITVGGKIKGTIVAQEKLVLESKALVQGDIRTAKLVIDEGAMFDGKCEMGSAKAMPNVVELKSEVRAQ
jgi:cytoskeletal protein CcmA (bactofilin family)